jgi:hypothetical protein
VSINEQQLGWEHAQVTYPLTELAHPSREQGKVAEAEALYRRALHIWEEQVGETHPHRAEAMQGLAQLREAQGTW